MKKYLFLAFFLFNFQTTFAQSDALGIGTQTLAPLTERFILDEVKNLRIDLEEAHRELNEKIYDKEYAAIDRALSYASNTVSYFFVFITLAVGVLALFGWKSIEEIKKSAHNLVEKESNKILKNLQKRLEKAEKDIDLKRIQILENQASFEKRQILNTLWGSASREKDDRRKLEILEEIEKHDSEQSEIYVGKSGSYLRLGLLNAALKACDQALELDSSHSIGFYNRACVHARLQNEEGAINDLQQAFRVNPGLKSSAIEDSDLEFLHKKKAFKELVG